MKSLEVSVVFYNVNGWTGEGGGVQGRKVEGRCQMHDVKQCYTGAVANSSALAETLDHRGMVGCISLLT